MRSLIAALVLCACTNAPAPSTDALVGTWSNADGRTTWRVNADHSWSVVDGSTSAHGTWSTDGAAVTLVPSDGRAPMIAEVERAGDRLALVHAHGTALVPTAELMQGGGGTGFADSTWVSSGSRPDQGGSCSVFYWHDELTLHGDGTSAEMVMNVCQPANIPYNATSTGRWTQLDDDAFVLRPDEAPDAPITLARFDGGITAAFFTRAP